MGYLACKCTPCIFFIQVYGQGTGYECRQHVQKLNMMRWEKEALIGQYLPEEHEFTVDVPPQGNPQEQGSITQVRGKKKMILHSVDHYKLTTMY